MKDHLDFKGHLFCLEFWEETFKLGSADHTAAPSRLPKLKVSIYIWNPDPRS